ncbi:cupredoxin domain-containing protein [Halobacterium jilantaiense]|uniref:hypothetical protein n=1 Tax=Halobacterium jilantaiense TaxID=355548 RepID=UPI00115F97BD|nr:hypothetical protein [Halobacterium jilantaiense]
MTSHRYGRVSAFAAVAVLAVAVAGSASLALAADPVSSAAGSGVVAHPTPDGDAEPETRVVENGSVVNANGTVRPPGCEAIQGERRLTVDAGREYAADGDAFGYDLDSVTAPACTRLVVTLVNHDDVRHQWVVSGLPTATYPGGYVAIEVAHRGSVTAAFVTPSESGTYEGLSTLPQHEQTGMQLPLVVTGGASDQSTATVTTTPDADGSAPGPGLLLAVVALAAAVLLAARQ